VTCLVCGISRGQRLKGWLTTYGSRTLVSDRDCDGPQEHLAGGAPAQARAGANATPVVIGSGAFRYHIDMHWAKLPPGFAFGDATSVAVDGADNVYVFCRGEHPVIVFDRDGNFLRTWGRDAGFRNPHGAAMGPDATLYLTDDGDHTVRQFDLNGNLKMTIGTTGHPAVAFSGEPFNRCTHTAVSPTGDLYVSDGYSNARVHKYSPNGDLLFSWGEPGTLPGQFNTVHNIVCDSDGWVYVADRENHRVQVFDGHGRFETQWLNLSRPCGLYMPPGRGQLCYIGELGPENAARAMRDVPNLGPRITITDARGNIQAFLGTKPLGFAEPDQFVAPHGVAVDSRGDIYVAEVSNSYWPILFGRSPDQVLPSFRKLIRVTEPPP
jgi:hypothetical protein